MDLPLFFQSAPQPREPHPWDRREFSREWIEVVQSLPAIQFVIYSFSTIWTIIDLSSDKIVNYCFTS